MFWAGFKKSNSKKKGARRRMAQGWECVAVEFGGTRPEAREYKTCVPWVAFVFPESETNEKLPYICASNVHIVPLIKNPDRF